MINPERGNFGTKLGVILATAGGAVGLGNVWRFPYVTGQNGGAAFILIYIGCVLVMGIPVMLCEMMIGRHAQANTARAYSIMGNGTAWKLVGYLGVLTSALILGYYSVVSGWTLQYIFSSIAGNIHGTPDYFKEYFTAFSTHPVKPIMWGALLIGFTHFVIVHGVQNGIEAGGLWSWLTSSEGDVATVNPPTQQTQQSTKYRKTRSPAIPSRFRRNPWT